MKLDELRAKLGCDVPDDLLQLALTHPSFTGEGESRTLQSNQRLEFLGDVIVGAVVAEYLYRANPLLPEGELTQRKAVLVRGDSLAKAARRLHLGDYLRLGKGEDKAGGRARDSVLSDAFEAIVGAIYLTGSLEAAQRFLVACLREELESAAQHEGVLAFGSAKNKLQELTQSIGLGTPRYLTQEKRENGARRFSSVVLLNESEQGSGIGKTKKEAESAAALQTFHDLQNRTPESSA